MAYADLRIGTIDTPIALGDIALMMYQLSYGDTTRMAQINAEGGVTGWVTPDYNKIHMAWNAVRFVAFQLLYEVGDTHAPADAPKAKVDGMEVYFFVNTNYSDEFTLYVEDADGAQYTLKADGMRTAYQGVTFGDSGKPYGGAQFDVAVFARGAFNHITYLGGNSVTSLQMSPAYPYTPLYLLNGVAQQGESSQKDWLTEGVRLLTRQTRIQPWSEDDDPEVTLLRVVGVPTAGGTVEAQRRNITNGASVDAINAELGENLLTWVPGCNGVAVRWMNDQGGVDGYVFTLKSKRQRKAKTSGVVNLYSPDPYQVKDTVNVYDIEAEDLIVLGVEGLPKDQYEVLRWLPLSRDIAIYRPEVSVPGNRWQSVTVEDYNVEDSVEQNAVNFEITIRMPRLNLPV